VRHSKNGPATAPQCRPSLLSLSALPGSRAVNVVREQREICKAALDAQVDAIVKERAKVLPLPECSPIGSIETCDKALLLQDAAVEQACSQGRLTPEQRNLICRPASR
jgi:hypothetical protein